MALKSVERRVDELDLNKQNNLVSGSTIKTINSTSLLGSGNVAVQPTLVSGTNIKTINGNSLLGSGDITISASSSITVGTTPITSGVDGRVLMQKSGKVENSIVYENGIGDVIVPTVSSGAIRGLVVGGDTRNSSMSITSYGSISIKKGGSLFLERSDNTNIQALSYSTTGFNLTIGAPASSSGFIYFNKQNGNNISAFDVNLGHFGIGTATPAARLDVRAQGALSTDIAFRVRNSVDTQNFLVVNGAGDVFNNGAGGVQSSTFYGENSGRSNTGINNSSFGFESGRNISSGTNNSTFGHNAGRNITTGASNTLFGSSAGINLNTGGSNTIVGQGSGTSATSTTSNDFFGHFSGQNTTGSYNSLFGSQTLRNQTTGNYNCALGHQAGRFISGGGNLTIANNSVFIGFDTRANADNQTNQIVIGHNAIGTGSNSVTLGNTSITQTNLRGQVVISGFASAPTGVEGAIYYDSTAKKHYGFNGTTWNALY